MGMWRKKPVVVQAWKWDFKPGQENDPGWVRDALFTWPEVGSIAFEPDHPEGPRICIATLDAVAIAHPGDYIVKGVKGELYPCRADIFEEIHELVMAEPDKKTVLP